MRTQIPLSMEKDETKDTEATAAFLATWICLAL